MLAEHMIQRQQLCIGSQSSKLGSKYNIASFYSTIYVITQMSMLYTALDLHSFNIKLCNSLQIIVKYL